MDRAAEALAKAKEEREGREGYAKVAEESLV
jgi:hypothetical protein